MAVNLLHVRFKVSSDIAKEQFDCIWEEMNPKTVQLLDGGDTAHFLVPQAQGASLLLYQLRSVLDQSLVADYGVVEVAGMTFVEAADNSPDGLRDEYEDDSAELEFSLADWWAQVGPPSNPESGFRRRGLLLITDDERAENCRLITQIRRHLGPGHLPHWHGRESLFLTFWGTGKLDGLLDSGLLGKAVRNHVFAGAYAFDLTNDYAAKHGRTSTLASWFDRGPSFGGGGRPPNRSSGTRQQTSRSPRGSWNN